MSNSSETTTFTSSCLKKLSSCTFYFLLSICGRESIIFGQIFEMEILMDLHVLRSSKSENYISSGWSLCMCVCVSACVSVSVISITQKQITAETSNLVLNISIIYRCFLKYFMKIGQKLCVQGNTKEF